MKKLFLFYVLVFSLVIIGCSEHDEISLTYKIVDTNQTEFYSDMALILEPSKNDAFYGQDANYDGYQPSYINHDDDTVTDQVTQLMWSADVFGKMSYEDAMIYANNATLAGYDDWRLPSIKELYALIQFDGVVFGDEAVKLFIDTTYFNQPLGNTLLGEREIDAQTWSSTAYVGLTMFDDETVFGVNFVDGRIKGYPVINKATSAPQQMYVRLVRGNSEYGKNIFQDNGDGTITDLATGLMWQQTDSMDTYNWEDALSYAEDLSLAGYDDWRLPNAKELQSIVDYTKSLQTSQSAAIDDLFESTPIMDIEGNINYGYYWTSTTHLDGINPYASAVYIAFGEAQGVMNDILLDVHGAGAQRSDPKSGDIDDYPDSFGPQGDIRYVYNFVRCVRG